MHMSAVPHRFLIQAPQQGQIALVLTDSDGAPWTLTMSPGSERFIGRYPRLESFAGIDTPLLEFRTVQPGC
jgi:hypothetical protein